MKINTLSTVASFKDFANISETTYDRQLGQFVQMASDFCEKYTGRRLRGRSYGSNGLDPEYKDGDDCSYFYTYQFPIISVESLYADTSYIFDASTLFASTDYRIIKDWGKIQLLANSSKGSIFNEGISNVKLSYTAGYDEFIVISGSNDSLDIQESAEVNIELTAGTYTASTLATLIQTALNADVTLTGTFAVTYNSLTGLFKITSDVNFTLLFSSGVNAFTSIASLIGFKDSADGSEAKSDTSDYSVIGVPEDLEIACTLIAMRLWEDSGLGSSRFDIESKSIKDNSGSIKFKGGSIPTMAKTILDRYKREGNF